MKVFAVAHIPALALLSGFMPQMELRSHSPSFIIDAVPEQVREDSNVPTAREQAEGEDTLAPDKTEQTGDEDTPTPEKPVMLMPEAAQFLDIVEQNNGSIDSIKWKEEVSMAHAAEQLEKKFFPFKEVRRAWFGLCAGSFSLISVSKTSWH